MDGLSEKINEILAEHASVVKHYKEEEEKLINKLNFCKEHNFVEEARIILIKLNAMNIMLSKYNDMFDNIQKAVDNWNS